MSRKILNYAKESTARGVVKRLLRRYPDVATQCHVDVVWSTEWQFPFRYLIRVTRPDGKSAYWSRA